MAKKISPKIQQAAEKYLDSLGSSREQLTEKQWEVVIGYVKYRRTSKQAVVTLLVFGTILACLALLAFQHSKKGVTSVIPKEVDKVVFIYKTNGESSKSLRPDDIRNYIRATAKLSWHTGSSFVLAIFMFGFAFIIIPLLRRRNRKMLEAFIQHKQETETSSPDKPTVTE